MDGRIVSGRPTTARPRSPALASRAAFGFGTGIGIGVALGGLAWVADQLDYPWSLVIPANAIGAWVGVGFLLGASARTVPTGALRGLIGLLSAVAAYYLLIALSGAGIRAIGASHAATIWGSVALVAGPIYGAAGGAWRHWSGWPRLIAVAVLSAALMAEGIVFGLRVGDASLVLLTAEAVIGALLPLLLLRPGERVGGYLATLVLAVAGGLAIGPFTTLIRGIADRF
jgi:hypothetical protein